MKAQIAIAAIITGAPFLIANQDIPEMSSDTETDNAIVFTDPSHVSSDNQNCRDTIRLAREERDLPLLQREPASPERPILFLALDHNIDGCGVLLTNGGDIRPLPEVDESASLLHRAQ
ncbi:hypothetical protein [Aurantiacibacter sp. MUD61]|uniref:hypothetical protein n=1 Tax=Aurantiacibacter sp. MUD61 TaxID=3009083 RepID=UPI0022F0D0AF|nr:hypothetical protein [Aurantiacibacter sp. MUD61]